MSIADDRVGRRRRLRVLAVIATVIGLAVFGWTVLSSRAINHKTADAEAELRADWRNVDLTDLDFRYSEAVTQANDTGDYAAADRLFPQVHESRFVTATLDKGGLVHADYLVEAWFRRRCIYVQITSPTPNRIEFQTRDRDCGTA